MTNGPSTAITNPQAENFMNLRLFGNPVFGQLSPKQPSSNKNAPLTPPESLDASDVWLTPANGRVVFDERGHTTWQWPDADDPFASQSSASDFDPSNLSILEPSEIRRSQRPWLHESERPGRTSKAAPASTSASKSPSNWPSDPTIVRTR